MVYMFLFLFAGVGLLVYGIREQKTRYGSRNFTEGEVVGHQTARAFGLMYQAVYAAAGVVNPLVSITLPNGVTKVVPLHMQIPRSAFSKFPELDLGGRVSVQYFGDDPREAFLTDHPFANKPFQVSTPLLAGIGLTLCGVALAVVAFFTV
ncbi:MAG: hypothetical protein MJ065_00695 [Oscillospiraceae bacterium]|nr:hypothetical protein [Oscillospiraceae bacterium]